MVTLLSSFKTMLTSLWTRGDTIMIAGNAMLKENAQAPSQMLIILFTRPILKILMTRDIMLDISNDMKNENTVL